MEDILRKFYRFEGYKAVVTEDNWATFKKTELATLDVQQYKEEMDEGIKVKTHFFLDYGEEIGKLVFAEFDKIEKMVVESHKGSISPSDGYGHHFEIFSMAVLHDQTYKEVIKKYWINGSRDGRVDAIFYDKEAVFCYQIKLGKLKPSDFDVYDYMKNVFEEYKNTKTLCGKNNNVLIRFLNEHYENDLKSKSVFPQTISTNGNPDKNVLPSVVIDKFLQKRFQRNKNDSSNALTFHVEKRAYLKVNKNLKEVCMFVNADDFLNAFKKHLNFDLTEETLESLFVKNVRGKMKINEKSFNTLRDHPEMFSFYNNGISILCDYNDQLSCKSFDIYNPLVINGQQTFYTIWFAAIEKNIDVSKASVPVFIKQAPKSETKNIALYNNTQEKIASLDLLSIDESLKKLQGKMLENIVEKKIDKQPIYYLKLTSSGKTFVNNNAEEFFGKKNIVQLSDFVKLYGSKHSPSRIGYWKNAVNSEIKKSYPDGFSPIDTVEANELCSIIVKTRKLISDHSYKVADLLVQFLSLNGFSEDSIIRIVDSMISKSLNAGKAKADIFRKKDTYEELKTACGSLGIDCSMI
jgi:hypothetical protein